MPLPRTAASTATWLSMAAIALMAEGRFAPRTFRGIWSSGSGLYMASMLFLIFSWPQDTSAQAPNSVGFHAGFSNSWLFMTSERNPNIHKKTLPSVRGFNAMVESEWTINRYVHIQIGIGYAERGFRRDYDLVTFFRFDEDRIDRRMVGVESSLDYVNLQWNAKITYPIRRFSPYVWVGPRYDVLVSRSDENIRFKSDGEPVEFSVAYTPLFDDTFWGITYGGGIRYTLTSKLRVSMDIGRVNEIGSSVGNNPNALRSIRGVDTRIGLNYSFKD